MEEKTVPVVFAANDNYAPYLGVTIYSLIKNASPKREYRLYVLATDLNWHHRRRLLSMNRANVQI